MIDIVHETMEVLPQACMLPSQGENSGQGERKPLETVEPQKALNPKQRCLYIGLRQGEAAVGFYESSWFQVMPYDDR